MRILLTTDTVGGVWDYTATLAHGLAADRHAVLLAVIGDPTDGQIAQLPEEIAIESRNSRLEWMPDGLSDALPIAEWLARLAALWRSDLVHLNQMAFTAVARFPVPTLVVVHSDVCSWFTEVYGHSPPPRWLAYRRTVRDGLRAADTVVAPTEYQAAFVRRHYAIPNVTVIHNAAPVAASPERWPEPPVLLSAGRAWDLAKGMGVLDAALSLLGDQAPSAHLAGAVDGPSGERFVAGRLTCHGVVTKAEVARLMRRATIYAAPSLYEPFGLAPLEAAHHGCALLLSDIGSFRELWDGVAEFFPCGTASALAAKVAALSSDPVRVAELGRAARERAATRYTPTRFVDGYLSAYGALASCSGAKARLVPMTSMQDV